MSTGVKRPERKDDHSPPPSAEVKYEWNYTTTPSVCLHAMHPTNQRTTPWNRAFFEKLTVAQLFKKYPAVRKI